MPSVLVETFNRMDRILPFLWIGDRFTAINKEMIEKFDIREILTVCTFSIPDEKKIKDVTYHHIPLDDLPSQNILLELEKLLNVLQMAIQDQKNILVHCEAGVSRSASVCCAYVMRSKTWPLRKALNHLKSIRFFVCPNEGFMKQLEIFEQLLWKADSEALNACQGYRTWLIDSGNGPMTEDEARTSLFIQKLKPDSKDLSRYRCIACRADLFYECHVQQHMSENGKTCKFGFLVDPLNWMNSGAYEGKILCPKCSSKIGSYCWGGRTCQGFDGEKCRAKVQPWFFISRDRVRLPPPVQSPSTTQILTHTINEDAK